MIVGVGSGTVTVVFSDNEPGSERVDLPADEFLQREWSALLYARQAVTLTLTMANPSPRWEIDLALATDEQIERELDRRRKAKIVKSRRSP